MTMQPLQRHDGASCVPLWHPMDLTVAYPLPCRGYALEGQAEAGGGGGSAVSKSQVCVCSRGVWRMATEKQDERKIQV